MRLKATTAHKLNPNPIFVIFFGTLQIFVLLFVIA
jgi:hypothetical protein